MAHVAQLCYLSDKDELCAVCSCRCTSLVETLSSNAGNLVRLVKARAYKTICALNTSWLPAVGSSTCASALVESDLLRSMLTGSSVYGVLEAFRVARRLRSLSAECSATRIEGLTYALSAVQSSLPALVFLLEAPAVMSLACASGTSCFPHHRHGWHLAMRIRTVVVALHTRQPPWLSSVAEKGVTCLSLTLGSDGSVMYGLHTL